MSASGDQHGLRLPSADVNERKTSLEIWKNGVIKTGGEKEWGPSRTEPSSTDKSRKFVDWSGQSQAVPTNPEHEADSDLSSERF
ncbi:hypothetical protein J6590_041028 [Homalodisca vitripennis]|nr:hypothetical protein J6590_041028 [Homalodisca vitripennis]